MTKTPMVEIVTTVEAEDAAFQIQYGRDEEHNHYTRARDRIGSTEDYLPIFEPWPDWSGSN